MSQVTAGGFGFLAFIGIIFSLAITVIWIIIGWRAMRAHEELSQSHAELRRDIRRLAETLSDRDAKENKGQESSLAKVDPARMPRFKD